MSDFTNIQYDPNIGIYFDVTIDEDTKKVFLDIALFKELSGKNIISHPSVVFTFFHTLRSTIYRMCLNAIAENPTWPADNPLPILKQHNK